MTLATAALFLVAVLTMAMWPEQARFGSPSQSVAQQQSDSGEDPFGPAQDPKPLPPKPESKPKPIIQPSKRTQDLNRIRRVLSQPMDLVYDSEPFGDVRATWAKDLGINIVLDMNLDGVLDGDTEVSANLADVQFSQGLRTILKAVDATYAIKDGVLLIISIDDEQEPDYLTRHMYDVREILHLIKEAESDRIGKPIAAGVAGGGAHGGGGVFRLAPQGLGGGGAAHVSPQPVPELLTAEDLLVDTITQIVSSDAWESNGTGNCNLKCIGGVLVVVSSELVAEEVEDFLADLEFQMKNQD